MVKLSTDHGVCRGVRTQLSQAWALGVGLSWIEVAVWLWGLLKIEFEAPTHVTCLVWRIIVGLAIERFVRATLVFLLKRLTWCLPPFPFHTIWIIIYFIYLPRERFCAFINFSHLWVLSAVFPIFFLLLIVVMCGCGKCENFFWGVGRVNVFVCFCLFLFVRIESVFFFFCHGSRRFLLPLFWIFINFFNMCVILRHLEPYNSDYHAKIRLSYFMCIFHSIVKVNTKDKFSRIFLRFYLRCLSFNR